MMKKKNIIIAVLLSVIAAYATVQISLSGSKAAITPTQESGYDRVMRTQTLRCAI